MSATRARCSARWSAGVDGRLMLSPDPTIASDYSSVVDASLMKFFSGILVPPELAKGMASPAGFANRCNARFSGIAA
jgi:hypothetical protein